MISQEHHKECIRLLNILINRKMQEKWSWVFMNPVEGIPDYHTIIKKPMDLGTVKKNLGSKPSRCRFKTYEKFAKDIRLVFQNALLYNKDDANLQGSVFDAAQYLLDLFEKEYSLSIDQVFSKSVSQVDESNEVLTKSNESLIETISNPLVNEQESSILKEIPISMEQLERITADQKKHQQEVREEKKNKPIVCKSSEKKKNIIKSEKKSSDSEMSLHDFQQCHNLLQKVMESKDEKGNELATPFYHAVDLKAFPDYKIKISKRYHLYGIEKKLKNHSYKDKEQFMNELRQMLSNCLIYNSDIELCQSIRENTIKLMKIIEQEYQEKLNGKWKGMSSEDRWKCHTLLNILLKHRTDDYEDSQWFKFPIQTYFESRELVPFNYFKVVKHPMDLGTVSDKLHMGKYTKVFECIQDLKLIFENCLLYWQQDENGVSYCNSSKILLHVLKQQVENIFDGSGCYDSYISMKNTTTKPSSNKGIKRTHFQIEKNEEEIKLNQEKEIIKKKCKLKSIKSIDEKNNWKEEKQLCLHLLKQCKKHKIKGHWGYEIQSIGPFSHPVDTILYPDYGTIISQPMDFSTVEKKIKMDNYFSLNEFIQDVHLIFSNCIKYNDDPIAGADIRAMANGLNEYFDGLIQEIKLKEQQKKEDEKNKNETQVKASLPLTIIHNNNNNLNLSLSPLKNQEKKHQNHKENEDEDERIKLKKEKKEKKKKDKKEKKKHHKEKKEMNLSINLNNLLLKSSEIQVTPLSLSSSTKLKLKKRPIEEISSSSIPEKEHENNEKEIQEEDAKRKRSKIVQVEESEMKLDEEKFDSLNNLPEPEATMGKILKRLHLHEGIRKYNFDRSLMEMLPMIKDEYFQTLTKPFNLHELFSRLKQRCYETSVSSFLIDGMHIFDNVIHYKEWIDRYDPPEEEEEEEEIKNEVNEENQEKEIKEPKHEYTYHLIEMAQHFKTYFQSLCIELIPLYGTEDEQKKQRMVRDEKRQERDIILNKVLIPTKSRECQRILKQISNQKHDKICWPFRLPVQTIFPDIGASDYFSIITQPMDLRTVSNRLAGIDDEKMYTCYGEFIYEMRLIFKNAMKYNQKIHQQQELKKIQEKKLISHSTTSSLIQEESGNEGKTMNIYEMAEIMLNLFNDSWSEINLDLVENHLRELLDLKLYEKRHQRRRIVQTALEKIEQEKWMKEYELKLQQQRIEEALAEKEREEEMRQDYEIHMENKQTRVMLEKMTKEERKAEEKKRRKIRKEEERKRIDQQRKTAVAVTDDALREAERRGRRYLITRKKQIEEKKQYFHQIQQQQQQNQQTNNIKTSIDTTSWKKGLQNTTIWKHSKTKSLFVHPAFISSIC